MFEGISRWIVQFVLLCCRQGSRTIRPDVIIHGGPIQRHMRRAEESAEPSVIGSAPPLIIRAHTRVMRNCKLQCPNPYEYFNNATIDSSAFLNSRIIVDLPHIFTLLFIADSFISYKNATFLGEEISFFHILCQKILTTKHLTKNLL